MPPVDFQKIETMLIGVSRPGRYLGNEWNVVKKDFDAAVVKIALCFPDAYEIGMSHLGFKILYHLLNEQPGVVCERVFTPWLDMQGLLKREEIPIFSLESKRPLVDFDIVGFSLGHELNYTNVLAMLSLAGIPLKSVQRADNFPLIIAGGVCVVNPEPLADFIDAFFIGEAEEGILEIVSKYQSVKVSSEKNSKQVLLSELAKIEGVYVPSFYEVSYNDDNTIKSFTPKYDFASAIIKKRIVKDFENSYYPVKQIVPYVQIVHDRISLEIMRGCPNRCHFCQATSVYRPVRLRSLDKVLQLAEQAYELTGYDEISLVSLSTGDHPQAREMVSNLIDRFNARKVGVSLPSLRAEDMLNALPQLISSIKKTGLTFAPEAGSQRLRDFVNKRLDIEKLHACINEAAKNGWQRIKLYFMIGLPSETEEDIALIAELVSKISRRDPAAGRPPISVTVSVSFFVPKPHTKFESEPMLGMSQIKHRQEFLQKVLRIKGAELKWHDIQMSFLEAVLSRGDRRVSEVLLKAFELGARFDSWHEGFNFSIWQKAFEETGVNPDFYLYRPRNNGEILPWAHINVNFP